MMIRVILADDDPIICQGLRMILETQQDIALCGVAENGVQAVELCRTQRPDVVLLDIRMPLLDGIEAAAQIMQMEAGAPLLLTTFDEAEFILRALKTGVRGYILKNSPAQRILTAVRAVAEGGTVFQQDILEYIRDRTVFPDHTIFSLLTPREMEVVALIAEGLSNKEIAERLFLSNGTVRNHISVILEKTGLEHRTQIAVHFLKGN
ncbi:response regulator receiver domain protein [[Clostridium] methylpentosum DSM 5476]|uniref:Stage 0 sporulation protein A homolog n=1 Tax=[Clostridium] methylpentosum DSM 5476 TaxID=537013 RepID=C0EEH8_9FIRM|nr:response regulator receiver domain protein [[Clostridium] methylpentosum DSM 5476]MDY3989284.1 response regulator transcription factor [Massilioclostridium sp.]MEE1492651.1 response regulator transcription factor [Massilioclostridium sp.]